MSERPIESAAQHQVLISIRGDDEHTLAVSQKCIQHIPTLRTTMLVDSTEQVVTFSSDMIPGGFVTLARVVDYVRAMCETNEPTSVPRTDTVVRDSADREDTESDMCTNGMGDFLRNLSLFQNKYLVTTFLSRFFDRQECADALRNTILAAEYLQVADLVCLLATLFVYACLKPNDVAFWEEDDSNVDAYDAEQQSFRASVFAAGPMRVSWLRDLLSHIHPTPSLASFIRSAIHHNAWNQLVWSPSDNADSESLIAVLGLCRRQDVALVRDALMAFDTISWASSYMWKTAFDDVSRFGDCKFLEHIVRVFGPSWRKYTVDRCYTSFIRLLSSRLTSFENAACRQCFEVLYCRFPHPFQPLDDGELEPIPEDTKLAQRQAAKFRAQRQAFPLVADDFDRSISSVSGMLAMRAGDMWLNATFVDQVVVRVVLEASNFLWDQSDFLEAFLWWIHALMDIEHFPVETLLTSILKPLFARDRHTRLNNRDLSRTSAVIYFLTLQPRFVAHAAGLEWIHSTSRVLNQWNATSPVVSLHRIRDSCMRQIVKMCKEKVGVDDRSKFQIPPRSSYPFIVVEALLVYFPYALSPAQQLWIFEDMTLADVSMYPHLWWLNLQQEHVQRTTFHEAIVVTQRDFDCLAMGDVVLERSALTSYRLKINRFRKLFANPAWSAFPTEMLRNVFEPLLLTAREYETRMIRRRQGERNKCWFGSSANTLKVEELSKAQSPKAELKRKFECVE